MILFILTQGHSGVHSWTSIGKLTKSTSNVENAGTCTSFGFIISPCRMPCLHSDRLQNGTTCTCRTLLRSSSPVCLLPPACWAAQYGQTEGCWALFPSSLQIQQQNRITKPVQSCQCLSCIFKKAELAVEDELCSVESDVVCQLKGPHGITCTKFHGDVNVFLGSVTWNRNRKDKNRLKQRKNFQNSDKYLQSRVRLGWHHSIYWPHESHAGSFFNVFVPSA